MMTPRRQGRAAAQGQDGDVHVGLPRIGEPSLAHQHGGEDGGDEEAHEQSGAHHDPAHHSRAGTAGTACRQHQPSRSATISAAPPPRTAPNGREVGAAVGRPADRPAARADRHAAGGRRPQKPPASITGKPTAKRSALASTESRNFPMPQRYSRRPAGADRRCDRATCHGRRRERIISPPGYRRPYFWRPHFARYEPDSRRSPRARRTDQRRLLRGQPGPDPRREGLRHHHHREVHGHAGVLHLHRRRDRTPCTASPSTAASLDPADVSDGVRIQLPDLAAANELTVVADAPYMNTGEGLHRFVDPVDNEVYLYTQFEVPGFPAHVRRVRTARPQGHASRSPSRRPRTGTSSPTPPPRRRWKPSPATDGGARSVWDVRPHAAALLLRHRTDRRPVPVRPQRSGQLPTAGSSRWASSPASP